MDAPPPSPFHQRRRLTLKPPRTAASGHRDTPSASSRGLAPVLVTSLSGNSGRLFHSKSAAGAPGLMSPGGSHTGNGGNDRGRARAALGSLGSQRNLKVGNLLTGKLRTGAAGGGSTELSQQYPRGGEGMLAALNLQVDGMLLLHTVFYFLALPRGLAGLFLGFDSCIQCFSLWPQEKPCLARYTEMRDRTMRMNDPVRFTPAITAANPALRGCF